MSTKRILTLPTIAGISAGSAAATVGLLTLPIGYRYHKLQFVYVDGGATPQDIIYGPTGNGAGTGPGGLLGDVVVLLNTKAQRTHSAAELDHLNSLNNVPGTTTYTRNQVNTAAAMRQTLNVFLAEPWRNSSAEADGAAWVVSQQAGINSFQVQLTLASAMPATGSLICYAVVDDPLTIAKGKMQAIKKVFRAQIGVSGTSYDVVTLDARDSYQTIALKNPSTTGYISQATFKLNGNLVLDKVAREDEVAHLTALEMSPANSTAVGSFGYDIVFDADGPLNSALPAAGQTLWLNLGFNVAAAGNVVALIERIGARE